MFWDPRWVLWFGFVSAFCSWGGFVGVFRLMTELAERNSSSLWPGNTLGSPQEELGSTPAEREVWVSLLDRSSTNHREAAKQKTKQKTGWTVYIWLGRSLSLRLDSQIAFTCYRDLFCPPLVYLLYLKDTLCNILLWSHSTNELKWVKKEAEVKKLKQKIEMQSKRKTKKS